MGLSLLFVFGGLIIIIGVILLFVSKSESETSIKIKNWIGVQTNSTGVILIIIGLLGIVAGVIIDKNPEKPQVVSNSSEKANPEDLARAFKIQSPSSTATILIRYKFQTIDSFYAVPEDYTFAELKTLLLDHFYPEERNREIGETVRYEILLNNQAVNDSSTLKSTRAKNYDRVSIIKHVDRPMKK